MPPSTAVLGLDGCQTKINNPTLPPDDRAIPAPDHREIVPGSARIGGNGRELQGIARIGGRERERRKGPYRLPGARRDLEAGAHQGLEVELHLDRPSPPGTLTHSLSPVALADSAFQEGKGLLASFGLENKKECIYTSSLC